MKNISNRGIATLPTVMVLGVMALAVSVGITAVSLTESFISQGSAQSNKALFYAEAGARDALLRIARNKNYVCATTDCYMVDFSVDGCNTGNDCATLSVSGDDVAKVVIAKGIMKSSTRTLQVNIVLDADGSITSTSWSEITI